ncbi:MAG: UDP-3-O-acyl-N-acetylglucosamine deacetylase [Psittacicella sp.]
MQKTIKKAITLSGVSLHKGEMVNLTLKPLYDYKGIVFYRSDIDAFFANSPDKMLESPLCTTLINDKGDTLSTVEHLNSALHALEIDNLLVEIDGPEIPILRGNAIDFIEAILDAGIEELSKPKLAIKILKEVEVVDGDKFARLIPNNKIIFNFTIDFSHSAIDKNSNNYILEFSKDNYIEEIAKARTFGFLKDIEYLKENNLIKGGSLDNAIVLTQDGILNEGGLLYKDELVRHKILDAIGDLYLANKSIIGEFIAYKSGHALNNRLLNKLLSDESNYTLVQI